ncbi:MAG: hypothetical protein GX766_06270, partial [Firmicutes bacterium]|nr:hypothetical protein [Bacillota bacterium]
MKKEFRKALSLFLVICVLFSMLPAAVIAADPPVPEEEEAVIVSSETGVAAGKPV